jgi:chromate transporter
MPSPIVLPQNKPKSCFEIFIVFTLLALQGFGGVISITQRILVEQKRWISQEEFLELFSVAQLLPGPNVCNLSLAIGDRFFGRSGAFSALAGMMVLPIIIVLIVYQSYGYFSDNELVVGAIRGMSVVAGGMTLGTALRLVSGLKSGVMRYELLLILAVSVFALVGIFRIPIYIVILLIGGSAVIATYRILLRRDTEVK